MARQDPIALAATLPCWGGRVSPVPLAGGLTNDNFLVEDGGERYVVRVGGDIPAHNIVRTTEAAASRAAHFAGVRRACTMRIPTRWSSVLSRDGP